MPTEESILFNRVTKDIKREFSLSLAKSEIIYLHKLSPTSRFINMGIEIRLESRLSFLIINAWQRKYKNEAACLTSFS